MYKKRRLLITSVGSLVGQNILDGLAHCRSSSDIVGLNCEVAAVSNFLCDRVHLTPPLAQREAFLACFDTLVRREQPQLIIPGRDDDVVFLAQWAAEQPPSGPAAMVGSPEMATVLRDKWLTCRFARTHALPFVDTRCAEDGFASVFALADEYGWPLIAKPRTGNASRGVVLVGSLNELHVAFSWPGYCFQPWLGERPDLRAIKLALQGGLPLDWSLPNDDILSLDGWIGPEGKVGGGFCTVHHEVKSGRTERLEVADSPASRGILEAYAEALRSNGWRGPFNIQLRNDDAGRPLAFELNGRFTGSSASLRWLGIDFVGEAIASFVGGASDSPPLAPTVSRIDKRLRDWAMPASAMQSLYVDGVWSRSEIDS